MARSSLIQNRIVAGQHAAVFGNGDGGSSATLVGNVAVVVCWAQHLDLTHGRAKSVSEVLINTLRESVRLDFACAWVAHRNLNELASSNSLICTILTATTARTDTVGAVGLGAAAVTTTFDRVESHIQASGDLPQGVTVQSIVQTWSTNQAVIGSRSVNNASGPIRTTNLTRNNDGLSNIGYDRHIDH